MDVEEIIKELKSGTVEASNISMPFFKILMTLLTVLTISHTPADAKAYYPTAKETIQQAVYIAVVTLGDARKVDIQGHPFSYREESDADLEKNIKGTLPKRFKIHGKETFICAHCAFTPGKALVFLKKDQDLFIGHGWNIACLPIKDGKVQWFKSLGERMPNDSVDLKTAVEQIRDQLKNSKTEAQSKE
jgi:hypothetical protein